MKAEEARNLATGIYRVWWTMGGSSVAAIGMRANGERWLAPSNWVLPAVDGRWWEDVERVEALDVERLGAVEKGETADDRRGAFMQRTVWEMLRAGKANVVDCSPLMAEQIVAMAGYLAAELEKRGAL